MYDYRNVRDEDGRTALHIAAHFGYPKVVKLLLDEFPDVNARDNDGMTALHHACAKGRKYAVIEIFKQAIGNVQFYFDSFVCPNLM